MLTSYDLDAKRLTDLKSETHWILSRLNEISQNVVVHTPTIRKLNESPFNIQRTAPFVCNKASRLNFLNTHNVYSLAYRRFDVTIKTEPAKFPSFCIFRWKTHYFLLLLYPSCMHLAFFLVLLAVKGIQQLRLSAWCIRIIPCS